MRQPGWGTGFGAQQYLVEGEEFALVAVNAAWRDLRNPPVAMRAHLEAPKFPRQYPARQQGVLFRQSVARMQQVNLHPPAVDLLLQRRRHGHRQLATAQAAADKKAQDIVVIDVADRMAITDAFVLASAPNERQVLAVVDAIEESLVRLPEKAKPIRREGDRAGRWVLLDFNDIVVHVQHTEEREFYALDRLWKDCPVIPFVDRDLVEAEAGATE
mgnify:CR=1 FL=1